MKSAFSNFFTIFIFILFGYLVRCLLVGLDVDVNLFTEGKFYSLLIYFLLAIGLYSSVREIDLSELKSSYKLVVYVVSIGVLLKAAIITILSSAIYPLMLSVAFALTVAQIDPLSVAALSDQAKNRLSVSGQTLLRAWSSFDDPITVILAIAFSSTFLSSQGSLTGSLLAGFALNLFVPLVVYVLYFFVKKSNCLQIALLILCFIFVSIYEAMFAISLIALFLRPNLSGLESKIIKIAFALSLIIVGMLLEMQFNLLQSLLVALFVVLAQFLATLTLSGKLLKQDLFYLSAAQQNGITAVILCLYFQSYIGNILQVIIPVIIFINIIHELINLTLDKFYISRPNVTQVMFYS